MHKLWQAGVVVGLVACRVLAGDDALVKRGEYLATGVGLCSDCHTPHGQKGELVMDKWLQGSTLPFGPLVPMPDWQPVAPYIAGLPTYTDDEAVKLFTEGVTNTGKAPRPPMPAFRFNQDDAKALVAYLRSLAPQDDAKPAAAKN